MSQRSLNVRSIDLVGLTKRYIHPGELDVIAALLVIVQAEVVVEIGVNEGRTAKAMLRNVPSISRYIGIDVLPGYQFGCKVQENEIPLEPGHLAMDDPRFELVLRNQGSLGLDPEVLRAEVGERGVCAVFVDGDHSAHAVLLDSALASVVVKPGGITIWHDYHNLGTVDVKDVLEEFYRRGRKIFHVEKTWIAFEWQK